MSNNVATHSVQVAWTGQLTGIFTIGRSAIGGTDVLGGSFGGNVFDDITADVKAAHYERGRAGDGGNMQQGTYQVKLKDVDGTYNPENPDSPLAPYLVPMRPIKHVANGPMVSAPALAPTFARASTAYKLDGSSVATGLPRFETVDGRQGLMVEEGATNLITNGSVEVDTAGYGANSSTITRITTDARVGSACLEVVVANATGAGVQFGASSRMAVTANTSYTFLLSAKSVSDPTYGASLRFWWYDSGGARIGGGNATTVIFTSDWGTYSLTATAPVGAVSCYVEVARTATGIYTYRVDGLMLKTGTATTYTDTVRAAEVLTIPTAGVLSAAEGTVECWFYETGQTGAALTWLVWDASPADTSRRFYFAKANTNYVCMFNNTLLSSFAMSGVGWHLASARWSGANVACLIDGVVEASTTLAAPVAFGAVTEIALGSRYTKNQSWLNSLISDLRISSRARTDAEIAAAYAAGTTLVDVDTTYKLPLDGTLVPQTWGNQGLFYGFISEISHDPDARESTISAVDLYEWLTMAKPVIATMTGARVDSIIAAILDAVEWTDPSMRLLDVSLDTVPSWSADGTKTALALITELLATDLGAFFIDGSGLARYINRRLRYGGATVDDTFTGSHISRIKASVSKDDIINSQTVTRTGGTAQTATDADSKRAYGSRVGSDITSDYLASDSHANSLAGFLVALKKNPRVPARSVGIINGDGTRLAKLLAREIGDLVAVTEARGGTDLVGRVQSLAVDISEGFTVQQGRYTVDKATLTPFVIGESVIGTGVLVY